MNGQNINSLNLNQIVLIDLWCKVVNKLLKEMNKLFVDGCSNLGKRKKKNSQ